MDADETGPTDAGPDDRSTLRVLHACEPMRGVRDCLVGDELTDALIDRALLSFLELQPGESLVALVSEWEKWPVAAFTSRRFCWHARQIVAEDPLFTSARRGGARWVELSAVESEPVDLGWPTRGLDLGRPGRVPLAVGPEARKAVAAALGRIAAGPGGDADAMGDADPRLAHEAVALSSRAGGVRERQAALVVFRRALAQGSRRVWVTPLIVATCVLLMGAVYMVGPARGIGPSPLLALQLAFANFGPLVANADQGGRMFTSIFFHIDAVHLALNMWCLICVGPLAERLYGGVGFAALFLLSGLGGSALSLTQRPYVFSLGASGAIFGVFGALLVFLVAHRHAVPPIAFKHMRASTLSFVVGNLVLGFMSPAVDNRAHVGGLVTGFLTGLLLGRGWPPRSSTLQVGRRVLGFIVSAIVLGSVTEAVLEPIRSDPAARVMAVDSREVAQKYNTYVERLRPMLEEFDAIQRDRKQLGLALESKEGVPVEAALNQTAESLQRCRMNLVELERAKPSDPELASIHTAFTRVAERQEDLLRLAQEHFERNERDARREEELTVAAHRLDEELARFFAAREAYLKAHGLEIRSRPSPASGK